MNPPKYSKMSKNYPKIGKFIFLNHFFLDYTPLTMKNKFQVNTMTISVKIIRSKGNFNFKRDFLRILIFPTFVSSKE